MNKYRWSVILSVFIVLSWPLTLIVYRLYGDPLGPIVNFLWWGCSLIERTLVGKGPFKSDKATFILIGSFIILMMNMLIWGFNLYHLQSLKVLDQLMAGFQIFVLLFVDDNSGPPNKGSRRKRSTKWKLRLIPQLT